MINAFLLAAVAVVLAEMGDKTQLLAMALATRFRWQTVLWAVFAATLDKVDKGDGSLYLTNLV